MAEREAKLVVTGLRPEDVADQLAALGSLGGRALRVAGTVSIRDVYFDTPAGALRARRDSLRVRVQDERAFLTWKGPGRDVGEGVTEREELETAWSAASYTELLEVLGSRGFPLRRAVWADDPLATLLASGLVQIQHRETRRRLRLAEDAGTIAELAIDDVTYRLTAGPVRHHEVEIEAKAPPGAEYLPRAVQDLRARFGAALTPWRHGKLATGFAIERLLASTGGARMVADGHLVPAAYGRLAAGLSDDAASPD